MVIGWLSGLPMKPEPLKGKYWNVIHLVDQDVFKIKDVRAAVEWLKYELENYADHNELFVETWTLDIINKAFEDVVKE